MIHFSVSPAEARLIMRALTYNHLNNPDWNVFLPINGSEHTRLQDRISLAVHEHCLRETEPTNTNLEEIETKGGIELCQRIS